MNSLLGGHTVLGMHRSGTSAVLSAMADCGCYLGEVGHNWERPPVWKFHDRCLAARGMRWNRIPSTFEPLITPEEGSEIDNLLEEFRDKSAWATKDPRMLLFFPYWYERAPMKVIGIFRDPAEVAVSLLRRDKLPLEKGLAAWTAYNQRLLRLHSALKFPLLNFNLPSDELRLKLRSALFAVGLSAPTEFTSFSPETKKTSERQAATEIGRVAEAVHQKLLGKAL